MHRTILPNTANICIGKNFKSLYNDKKSFSQSKIDLNQKEITYSRKKNILTSREHRIKYYNSLQTERFSLRNNQNNKNFFRTFIDNLQKKIKQCAEDNQKIKKNNKIMTIIATNNLAQKNIDAHELSKQTKRYKYYVMKKRKAQHHRQLNVKAFPFSRFKTDEKFVQNIICNKKHERKFKTQSAIHLQFFTLKPWFKEDIQQHCF